MASVTAIITVLIVAPGKIAGVAVTLAPIAELPQIQINAINQCKDVMSITSYLSNVFLKVLRNSKSGYRSTNLQIEMNFLPSNTIHPSTKQ